MKRREFLIIGLLVLGGFVSIFLNDIKPLPKIIGTKSLLHEVNEQGRYISTDEVARMIMENDPSLLLVDIRSPEEYNKFSIQGALNIPAAKLLEGNNKDYFNQDVYTVVLYSNGSSAADEAWMMLSSFGYTGNKVLKGGLNAWYRNILNPQKPKPEKLTAELEKQYLFRKGAQIFFTGIQVSGASSANAKPKAPSKPIVKRKKKEVTGGCG